MVSMKVFVLDDQQQLFLLHVFTTYCAAGLPPTELGIAAATYQSVTSAREVPVEPHLGHCTVAQMSPNGLALEVEEEYSQ